MVPDKPDATWLFARRDPSTLKVRFKNGQHSESWWTALFSLFLLHYSVSRKYPKIPLRRPVFRKPEWEYPPEGVLDYKGLTFSSFLTERRLNEQVAKSFFDVQRGR
jgi:hypothetical protein